MAAYACEMYIFACKDDCIHAPEAGTHNTSVKYSSMTCLKFNTFCSVAGFDRQTVIWHTSKRTCSRQQLRLRSIEMNKSICQALDKVYTSSLAKTLGSSTLLNSHGGLQEHCLTKAVLHSNSDIAYDKQTLFLHSPAAS